MVHQTSSLSAPFARQATPRSAVNFKGCVTPAIFNKSRCQLECASSRAQPSGHSMLEHPLPTNACSHDAHEYSNRLLHGTFLLQASGRR